MSKHTPVTLRELARMYRDDCYTRIETLKEEAGRHSDRDIKKDYQDQIDHWTETIAIIDKSTAREDTFLDAKLRQGQNVPGKVVK